LGKHKGAVFDRMEASADYLGNGAIETNMYETEIFDLVRRSSPALQRFDTRPATGQPHRYFEQTAIATATFTPTGGGGGSAINPTPSSPTRVEDVVTVRALTDQTNFSLFDIDVTRQQGQFAYLEAKDLADLVKSIEVLRASAIYTGNAANNNDLTTTQYCGLLTQITQQATISIGSSIIDGLKAEIAAMVANVNYVVKPTAIMLNPILADYLDREARAGQIFLGNTTVEAGLEVRTLMTQAGSLPLIPDPYIPADTTSKYGFAAPAAGYKNYYALILMEGEIELPYVGGADQNPNPRLFQLGLLAGLQGQYVVIKFDTIVAKGPSYAHAVVAVVRP
jgi:hypothetical protein